MDDTAADWHVDAGHVIRDGEKLLPLAGVAARGRHNHANLLAAWAAAHAAGVPDAAAHGVFASYLPPANRYELVATLNGVDYINDSKSTNLHSLQTALEAEDRPFVLIAGGKEKGLDFTPLAGTDRRPLPGRRRHRRDPPAPARGLGRRLRFPRGGRFRRCHQPSPRARPTR